MLAFEGPVYGAEVGFELAPPLHHSRRFPFGLGLPLFGCLLRESAPLQFGPGFPGCFPPRAGVGGPYLVAGVRGFELLALSGHVAGERLHARPAGRVVLGPVTAGHRHRRRGRAGARPPVGAEWARLSAAAMTFQRGPRP
jgi:hypothetical protein